MSFPISGARMRNRPFPPARSGLAGFGGKSSSPCSGIGMTVSFTFPALGFWKRKFQVKTFVKDDCRIEKPRTGKWIKRMALAAAAFIMFSYLYSRGISPVWAAVAIVCFRGFFRFLYKIACLLVAAAILFCILSCLVF